MSKNKLKFSISSIIIILSLMLGYVVSAEGIKGKVNVKVQEIKDELVVKREEFKSKIDRMIKTIKVTREEFKNELSLNKEQAKTKIEAAKIAFKENITKIKDENKKISAEKIVNTIQELNIKLTEQLSSKINQIENVLVSIDSRISKTEAKGVDVSKARAEFVKAKDAITKAREAISIQSQKVYTTTIVSEATLKTDMKALRDTFKKEMTSTSALVKASHTAVKTVATTLAKIPNVDIDEVETPVNNTTNN